MPSGPLTGEAAVPGDKSISHRALILGGLASGRTRIDGLLESLDVLATASAVEALGAKVERVGAACLEIEGTPWRTPDAPIDCGNSGTTARLLMGAVAGFPIRATFTGDESLRRRPMQRVLDPLRSMGVSEVASSDGRLPLTLSGGGLRGIRYVNHLGSAQVKSAILLAGLGTSEAVEIIEPRPSRDHSEQMLAQFGCEIEFGGGVVRLGRQRRLRGSHVRVPGDPSSAAFPIVAALLVPGSQVRIPAMLLNPLRNGLLETLREMGADIAITLGEGDCAEVEARWSQLKGVEVPPERFPAMVDEYPVLAVAASFAAGRTVMRGLSELRVKESDRLAAMVEALTACGVDAVAQGDDLVVEGRDGAVAGGARIRAKADHRIAMSMLVLGLAARAPVTSDSAGAIATSFPDFAATIQSLGGKIA